MNALSVSIREAVAGVTQLGQLAAVIGKFSPYAPILDFFLPKKNFGNPTIAYDRTAIGEVRVGAVRDTGNILDLGLIRIRYYRTSDQFLYSILRVTLEEKQLLEDDVFKAIYPAGDNKKLVSIRFAEIPQLREQLNRYLAAITAKKIQLLQGDSTFTMQLIQIYNQSTLPELEPLKPATNKIPVYYSKILETKHSEDAIERTVEIYTLKNKDTSRLNKFTYKVGKNYRFKLGAGIAYTLNSYDQTQLKESNGQISVVNNVQQYRFVAGIHYYFGKGLFMQNSQLIKWRERNSLFIGVGIPDPLGNLYFALSHDLVPGLKISAGVHVAKNNKYFVQNNVILEESLRYKAAGPFIAIMIDPVGLVNLLNVFKKQ